MEKTYTIEFIEQAKGVVARTKIEGSSEDHNELLEEGKKLFEEAYKFAHKMTLRKVI